MDHDAVDTPTSLSRPMLQAVLDDDVAVYDAPVGPLDRGDAASNDPSIRDGAGTRWTPTHEALVEESTAGVSEESLESLDRFPGRHGLWLAFRPHYDTVHVAGGDR